jgi:hypothetical protein
VLGDQVLRKLKVEVGNVHGAAVRLMRTPYVQFSPDPRVSSGLSASTRCRANMAVALQFSRACST